MVKTQCTVDAIEHILLIGLRVIFLILNIFFPLMLQGVNQLEGVLFHFEADKSIFQIFYF